ncbi:MULTISPECIES: DUF2490 domain-containing protein [unclassified Carboxylicivirga]|uniref:DUF2490 domain-containing protein n=1 Tax=Carboxylicivirga TaxID=1628153 RepID=UPI003D340389
MKPITILILFIITPLFYGKAQQNIDFRIFNNAGELRSIYVQQHRLGTKYRLNLDAGSYLGLGDNTWTRWGFRGSLQTIVSHLIKVDAGLMYNRVFTLHTNPGSEKESKNIRHEYRPHQSLNASYPRFKSSALQHRFRLEERIFRSSDDKYFKMRLRYRISHQGRFDGKAIAPKSLFYSASAELYFNVYEEADDVFLTQGRYGLGLGYQISSKLSADINHYLQHSKSSHERPASTSSIFQITLRQKFYWMN